MSSLRTATLLAALTAIVVAVGCLIGGSGGALIACLIAAERNPAAARLFIVNPMPGGRLGCFSTHSVPESHIAALLWMDAEMGGPRAGPSAAVPRVANARRTGLWG